MVKSIASCCNYILDHHRNAMYPSHNLYSQIDIANCSLLSFQKDQLAVVKKGLRLSWIFVYGLRPWYAWLSRYPKELTPEKLVETIGHDSTKIASFGEGLRSTVTDTASKVTEYVGKMHRSPGAIDRDQAVLLYMLIRLHRPKVVVETGVGQGVSTTFLLKGLHDNEEGRLFSIDLPFYEGGSNSTRWPFTEIYPIPKGLQPGWMVPDYLRDRWELLQGDTKVALGPLLDRLGSIDLFLQDDLHDYRHMLWEFRTTWPHISKDGLLFSHDWAKNPALCQFVRDNSLSSFKCCRICCVSKLYT